MQCVNYMDECQTNGNIEATWANAIIKSLLICSNWNNSLQKAHLTIQQISRAKAIAIYRCFSGLNQNNNNDYLAKILMKLNSDE